MPGTVVTFYSYKGGVGRSFTLANIAVLLARWGYRVLCLDWDLEAPGLHHYFQAMTNTPPAGGVIDLVDDFLAGRQTPVDHTVRLAGVGPLDFIAAGKDDADYVGRVQDIDWESLYQLGFAEYLERCREQWTADYDFVLLDSRTGVSDIGGICTAHLPDRLVVLFTANLQSIKGAVDIAKRANEARDRMPYDRAQLTVLPVLSRFDTREEYDRAEEWRRICLRETEDLYANWLHRAVETEVVSRHLTLPYVSYWSFGEQLPVLLESNPSADQIGFALETVAAIVAHDFDRTDLLAENRDTYVAAIRTKKREFVHRVRVSTSRPTLDSAIALIDELNRLGVDAVSSLSGDRKMLAKIDDSQHLCLVIDDKLSRWQLAEVELFVHRTLGQDRRVIPVLTTDTDPNGLPGFVGNLRYLRLGSPAVVAQALADQLNHVATKDDGQLLAVLRQAAGALLRPSMWQLTNEIVRALHTAVQANDETAIQEAVGELALVIRSRSDQDHSRRTAPENTRAAIEQVARLIDTHHSGGNR